MGKSLAVFWKSFFQSTVFLGLKKPKIAFWKKNGFDLSFFDQIKVQLEIDWPNPLKKTRNIWNFDKGRFLRIFKNITFF